MTTTSTGRSSVTTLTGTGCIGLDIGQALVCRGDGFDRRRDSGLCLTSFGRGDNRLWPPGCARTCAPCVRHSSERMPERVEAEPSPPVDAEGPRQLAHLPGDRARVVVCPASAVLRHEDQVTTLGGLRGRSSRQRLTE